MKKITDLEVADTLDAAADYMAVHGKCSGEFRSYYGEVCALGAMACAVGNLDLVYGIQFVDPIKQNLFVKVREAFRDGNASFNIPIYSDRYTALTVIRRFRRIAKKIRKQITQQELAI